MLHLAKEASGYAELTRLILKHGGRELARALGWRGDAVPSADGATAPETLASDIEALGPAYIKFAQIASTRHDLLPEEYIEALARLRDDVAPADIGEIRELIADELGAPVDKLFAEFEQTPIACASLGQVHGATLQDGTRVVVKVQRPGVDDDARAQLQTLRRLAGMVDSNTAIGSRIRFRTLVDAVDYALSLELDYRREASHLESLAEQLEEFDRIEVPVPIASLVSRRVIVMTRLMGTSLADISGVVLAEIDTEELANQLVKSYLKQILIDGLFHADPHPGNLMFTEQHNLGLIDGGMMVSVSPKMRRKLAGMLLAISKHDGDEAARLAIQIGHADEKFDSDLFIPAAARIVAHPGKTVSDGISIGRIAMELLGIAGQHHLTLPFELILFSKAIIQLEGTLQRLSPQMDVREIVRRYSGRVMRARAGEYTTIERIARTSLASAELAAQMPERLNRITELISENELKVRVDAFDEERLENSARRIANRITAGLVTSALLVAASLIMRIETGLTVLGYPVLSTVFFLLAAVIGLYLVWIALVRDV